MEFNTQELKQLLDGFKGIPMSAWDHSGGFIELDEDGGFPDKGFCIGHKVCDLFNIPAKYNDRKAGLILNFEDGVECLCKLLGLDQDELELMLYNEGAPDEPFGELEWESDPFMILKRVVRQVTGFDYDAERVTFGMGVAV